MRRSLLGLLTLAPAWAAAQSTVAGTKPDLIATPASGAGPSSGIMPLFQLLLALGIVFALVKYVLPKAVAKTGRRLTTKVGSPIGVRESAAFGGGMLYVVEVRNKALLLSVGAQGVVCLAELTEGPQPAPAPAAFQEILDEQPAGRPAPYSAVVETDRPGPSGLSESAVRDMLGRIDRLTNAYAPQTDER